MKIKVKIAVAANAQGQWNAYGWTDSKSWDETMDAFDQLDGNERRFWVEAELEVPDTEAEVVTGTAVPA